MTAKELLQTVRDFFGCDINRNEPYPNINLFIPWLLIRDDPDEFHVDEIEIMLQMVYIRASSQAHLQQVENLAKARQHIQ